ncbi:YciK family oxidoreductase [Halioglobus japonicus]|uniref:YciK family oxidoreductase n=1 Tax=Halioglobus japonicus TaxID=930805 RepID=A0AAP8MGP0_9GAMM|nr:YciK family oxidoreductase [Halioglobus japonicus]AQA19450.1 YciK family oxidoreductase [Halioglobus japonicus]PLW87493.1 YciK family oxidoreductase [Halioglobus japonicus]GHD08166.1 YciK family oxidoreductase [Halioglobus japonicus]
MNIVPAPADYQPSATLLEGRTILVTGAGDGIGRAASLAYAAHGATVILLGRTESKLDALYDQIEAAGYPKPAIVPMDLLTVSEEQCMQLVAQLADEFGHIDGLLHNASVLGERRPIESATYAAWQEVMQVNVNATFLLTRHLLPLLQAAPSASIVFTSSGVGRTGRAFWGAYAVSKFATEGLMEVLAAELDETSNIRVNCINPGATNTAMRRSAYPAEHPDTNPAPEDIMGAYLYLMGKDSGEISGSSFDAQP